jgi:hypothetical protein
MPKKADDPIPDLRALLAQAERPEDSCRVQIRPGVEVTFHFHAPTFDEREGVWQSMDGRDDPNELDLRATAAVLHRVTMPDGSEGDASLTWEDFRDLRDRIGVPTYEATIKRASDSVWSPQWSVPFSSSASPTLETET